MLGVAGTYLGPGQPEPSRVCGGFAAGADIELAQDCRDVMIDRLLGHDQALGDLGVAEPFGQ
jgi:hypothetical protein